MLIVEIMVVMVGALRVVGVVVIVMIVTMEAGVIMEETMMRPDAEKWLGIGGADDKEYFGLKDLNVFTPHDANNFATQQYGNDKEETDQQKLLKH